MIRRFFCGILAAFCLCGCANAAECATWVRLHVVADGNSAYQQALKLQVRNACLECAAVCLADAEDADSAYILLEESLPIFENAALCRAREAGYTGSVRAEVGIFSFPERIYGNIVVPEGQYRALRVVIGGGEGHNWWCVLYPSLCFLDESVQTDEELPPSEGLFYELFAKWRSKL